MGNSMRFFKKFSFLLPHTFPGACDVLKSFFTSRLASEHLSANKASGLFVFVYSCVLIVKLHVSRAVRYFKILWSVVVPYAVFVVDKFSLFEFPTNYFLHNMTMKEGSLFSGELYPKISLGVFLNTPIPSVRGRPRLSLGPTRSGTIDAMLLSVKNIFTKWACFIHNPIIFSKGNYVNPCF
jgi:hypothetical protein